MIPWGCVVHAGELAKPSIGINPRRLFFTLSITCYDVCWGDGGEARALVGRHLVAVGGERGEDGNEDFPPARLERVGEQGPERVRVEARVGGRRAFYSLYKMEVEGRR